MRGTKKRLIALFALLFVTTIAFAGFGAPTTILAASKPSVSVTRVNTGKVTLKKGAKYKLSAKASKGAKLSYESSKPNIVSVSKKGVLKAKKTGKATITVRAKNGSKKTSKRVKITVVAPKKYKAPKELSANAGATTLAVGSSTKVTVAFAPKKTSNKNVVYKSSASAVASVSASGTVKAKKPGTAKITVSSCANPKVKASLTITVKKPGQEDSATQPPASEVVPPEPKVIGAEAVALSASEEQIEVGQSVTLAASVAPEDASDKSLVWSTSDDTVASVDNGVVSGVGPGLAVITATAGNGVSADCEVRVSMAGAAEYDEFLQACKEMVSEYGWDDQLKDLDQLPDDPYYSGRLIVKDDGETIDFSSLPTQPVASENDGEGYTYLQFASSDDAHTAYEAISGIEHVSWVAVDGYMQAAEAAAGEEDPALRLSSGGEPLSWGTTAIGADDFAKSLAGRKGGVIVAVLDSGVDATHPFLKGRVLSDGFDFVGIDDNDPSDEDEIGHGTHVSGIIVDATPGLTGIKVLPIRVVGGFHPFTQHSAVVQGIKYAVKHGAKVINMSLNGPMPRFGDPINDAIEYAVSKGVTVVVSAGNQGDRTAGYTPSNSERAIVVGAVDSSGTRADFSNMGSSVDFVAPGVSICSCVKGGKYVSADGTSQAAPYISAAAAMIQLKHPQYISSEVEGILRGCAVDLGPHDRDDEYGYGIPNLRKISGGGSSSGGSDIPDIQDVAKQSSLSAYTWSELKAIANAIAAAPSDWEGLAIAKAYGLVDTNGKLTGETKDVEVEGLGTAQVRICGFRHDELTDGTGCAGITFEFANTLCTHEMNATSTNSGGWEACEMRSWLNSEYLAKLPSSLSNSIASVYKATNNAGGDTGGDASVVTTTTDKLWLLSMSEVYGTLSAQSSNTPTYPAVYNAEGTQYQLYSDQGVTTTNYDFCAKTGSYIWWWLRSPDAGGSDYFSSDYFHYVYDDGDWGSGDAGLAYGVAPGFCF